ncbi:MAG: hypothetical protein ACJ8FY_04140 [Gemmataceae bacterium]
MAVKTGESKQTLIIFLVLFVLLTVILGITTYLGYDGQKALDTKAKEETANAKKWEKTADWYRFQGLQYRAYMGAPLSPPETEELGTLRASFGDQQDGTLVTGAELDKRRTETAKFIRDELDKRFWDPANKKITATLSSQIQDLQAKADQATKRSNETQATLDQTSAKLKETTDALEKAKSDYAKQLAALEGAFSKKQEGYLAEIDRLQHELQDKGEATAKTKGSSDEEVAKIKKENDRLLKQIKQMDDKNKNLERQIPKISRIDLDQPKAKVESLDKTGRVAYIDVGSADNARPQLTFRVVGTTPDGKPGKEKGSLEITRVIGAHQSQARITDVTDANREPVLAGDLLYNPAWSPNLQKHIAIAGIIDLAGEGQDNTQEFIRGLKQQGVAVDAYIDLKETAIKGEINRLTEYLVVGPLPQDAKIKLPKDRQEAYDNKINELQNAAKANGVTLVPLREFLTLIGYRIPKVIQTGEENYNFKLGGVAPTPAAAPTERKDKEKEKEDTSTDKKGKSQKDDQ